MAVITGIGASGCYLFIALEVVMSFAEFHFIRPTWLLAMFPYLVIIVLMLRNKLSRGNWSTVCDAQLLPYLLQEKASQNKQWALTSGAISAFLVIIALAGPSWQRVPSPVFRNESALVIALDLSRSMDAEDIKPSRLIRAHYKIADILKRRKDGQTALLVYSGAAFTVTPLTDDTETIASQLTALTTDIMPSEGNNAELVLNKAVALFKQAGLQKGQILLVTDGVDVDKTKSAVTELESYSLSILGVGTTEGAPIAAPEGGFLKDEHGSIVIPKLNAADLEKLAQQGNGIYQTISTDDSDILALLSALEQPLQQQGKENKNLLLDQWEDKGPWLLLLVLPLAALNFRKGLLTIAFVLLLPLPKNSYAVEWQDLWQNKDQQAEQAYKNKQFDQAASLFENSDWKAAANYKAGAYDKALQSLASKPDEKNAAVLYNQGNVLAQSGQLESAIKAYEKALALNPDDNDAKYNKELVEKVVEKQKQEQKKKEDKQDKQEQSDKDDQQKKDSESSDKSEQQKASDQKPEQSEEKKSQQQQADEQGTPDNKKPEKQPEADKAQQAAEPKKTDAKQQSKQTTEIAQPTTEQQQANEQWLNRIPDDPAGLLKRKFKYQYGQQRGQ
jgi:Ca-activated chloride channel family protein